MLNSFSRIPRNVHCEVTNQVCTLSVIKSLVNYFFTAVSQTEEGSPQPDIVKKVRRSRSQAQSPSCSASTPARSNRTSSRNSTALASLEGSPTGQRKSLRNKSQETVSVAKPKAKVSKSAVEDPPNPKVGNEPPRYRRYGLFLNLL